MPTYHRTSSKILRLRSSLLLASMRPSLAGRNASRFIVEQCPSLELALLKSKSKQTYLDSISWTSSVSRASSLTCTECSEIAPLSVPTASSGPLDVEVISTAVALSVILRVETAVHSWFGSCFHNLTVLSLDAVAKNDPSDDQQQSNTILE